MKQRLWKFNMIKVFLLYQEHNNDCCCCCCCCCCCLRASCKTTQKGVVTPRKVILVSVFHDFRYGILDSLSLALGLRIPDSNCQDSDPWAQFWIPRDKISRIPESTNKNFQDYRVHKQKFPGFWNPDRLTWGDCELRPMTVSNLIGAQVVVFN